ncbi:hypothetical protein Q3G72_024088 [Acer saccharum]|nr:hypothetical protein Q3G72_024088 [Acer saccharum]
MRLDSRKDPDGDHIVSADEIAKAVRCVMDGDSEITKKVMVKEFGLAVEMRLDSRMYDGDDDHLVMADEIARAIRCVMDGDNEVRKKVKEMSVIARKSTLEGGSSFNSLGLFIDMNF